MIAAWITSSAVAAIVTTPNATGTGSLTAAIQNTPANGSITFSETAFPPGQRTPITLSSALPTVTRAGVTIVGADRVAIVCGPSMTTGNGLTVAADRVVITGLEISGCPESGLQVSGHDVVVGTPASGNLIHDNDVLGVLVTGLSTVTSGVRVEGSDVHGNCGAAGSTSCAGVGVKKGVGSGLGPLDVSIVDNEVWFQYGLAPGIGLFAGADHHVDGNAVTTNTGPGITVAANTGVTVQADSIGDNDIELNGGPGILLGARSWSTWVHGNLVRGNGDWSPSAGIEVFGSDLHVIEGNEILENTGAGILVGGTVSGSPAETLSIRDNLVGDLLGTAPDDTDSHTAAGNLGDGISITGSGTLDVHHTVERNVVASSGGYGIVLHAGGVVVTENAVGLVGTKFHLARPNGAAGIWIGQNGVGVRLDGKVGGVSRPNVVGSNGGDGIVSYASNVLVADNVIGWNLDRDAARGNAGDGVRIAGGSDVVVRNNVVANSGGDGVRVEPTLGLFDVLRPVVNGNAVASNGGAGIRVTGSVTTAVWTRNEVHDNGTCAVSVGTSVNPATREAVPVLVRRTGPYLEGTFTVPPGATLERIEVFADAGSEAGRFLGIATIPAAGQWRLTVAEDAAPVQATDRVAAVAVFADGSSSRLQEWCGDGCPLPGTASCEDGDDWHRNQPEGPDWASFGFRAALDADGAITSLVSDNEGWFGGEWGTDGTIGVGYQTDDQLGEGTDRVITFPNPTVYNSGIAALYGPDLDFRWGWHLDGNGQEMVYDAAFDLDGGLWVAGSATGDLVVRDAHGTPTTVLPTPGPHSEDGFLLHFAAPP